jgi:hypothetical protein
MRNFSLFAFVAALFAIAFTGPASAEPNWGWGECQDMKTLSVENEEGTDQSIAENPTPETPKTTNEN